MKLTTIGPDEYATRVLPHSAAVWAGDRSYDRYVADFYALTASSFGRKRFRTIGLREGENVVASFKRYERELRCEGAMLRAVGIGAVFTPEDLRGRGYATAMLGAFLDAERAQGTDVAFLFSDIHPVFYERLGFTQLPSRIVTLRADALDARRIDMRSLGDGDWSAIRRCFDALDARRTIALRRTPLVWEWIRLRFGDADRPTPGRVALGAWRGKALAAYVLGRREPRTDAFVVDEFAYTGDEGFDAIPSLLRSAAGDLRKVTGWLPPDPARTALPRGAVRKRKTAIAMIAPLSALARTQWALLEPAAARDAADRYWSFDHV